MNITRQQGLVFIISAPSGGGKSSMVRSLIKHDQSIKVSISVTTRSQRAEEQDGVSYYFLSVSEFKKLLANDMLLEHAKIYDNYYGTPKQPVLDCIYKGYDMLFDIDAQGAQQIKQQIPLYTVSIFMLPPSIEVLRQRLESRKQDSTIIIEQRIQAAETEIKQAKYYDYVIMNDDFDYTVKQIQSIMIAEKVKHAIPTYLKLFNIN